MSSIEENTQSVGNILEHSISPLVDPKSELLSQIVSSQVKTQVKVSIHNPQRELNSFNCEFKSELNSDQLKPAWNQNEFWIWGQSEWNLQYEFSQSRSSELLINWSRLKSEWSLNFSGILNWRLCEIPIAELKFFSNWRKDMKIKKKKLK